jgi:hypothetical protein
MFGWVRTGAAKIKGLVGDVTGAAKRMLGGIMPVGASDPPPMGTQQLLEAYEEMPWLQMAARKASDGVAGALNISVLSVRRGGKTASAKPLQYSGHELRETGVKAARRAGQLVEHPDHVFLVALNDPNPYMTRRGLLHVTNSHIDIVGDAYWFIQRNALGKPAGYWPIPAFWVLEVPTVSRPQWRLGYRGWQVFLDERDILHFHDPGLANPYGRGAGVGWALADDLEVDEYLAKMAKSMFFNQARPDFVVYGFSSKTEKDTAEKNWLRSHQGFWRTARPHFMGGEPKFEKFEQPTMDKIMYPEFRKRQRDIVLQVYGHPPEIFGIIESSNRATIDAAFYLFQVGVVAPRAERIIEVLQRHVATEFDPRILLHYPSSIPEDKEFKLKVATAMPQSLQMDEWRELSGLPAWGDARGQGYAISVQHHMSTDLFAPPPPRNPAPPPQKDVLALHVHSAEQRHEIHTPISVQPSSAVVHVDAAPPPDVNVTVQPSEVRAGDIHASIHLPGQGVQDVEVVRDAVTREITGVKAVTRDSKEPR